MHCQGHCRAGSSLQPPFHQELKRGKTFQPADPQSASGALHPAHGPHIQGCHLTVSSSSPCRLQPWKALLSLFITETKQKQANVTMTRQKKAEIKVTYFSLQLVESLSKMPVFLPAYAQKTTRSHSLKIPNAKQDHSAYSQKTFFYQLQNGLSI